MSDRLTADAVRLVIETYELALAVAQHYPETSPGGRQRLATEYAVWLLDGHAVAAPGGAQ